MSGFQLKYFRSKKPGFSKHLKNFSRMHFLVILILAFSYKKVTVHKSCINHKPGDNTDQNEGRYTILGAILSPKYD